MSQCVGFGSKNDVCVDYHNGGWVSGEPLVTVILIIMIHVKLFRHGAKQVMCFLLAVQELTMSHLCANMIAQLFYHGAKHMTPPCLDHVTSPYCPTTDYSCF